MNHERRSPTPDERKEYLTELNRQAGGLRPLSSNKPDYETFRLGLQRIIELQRRIAEQVKNHSQPQG